MAYLGIADRKGLLAWWPEHPHLWRFLQRRQAQRPREICFWAVLAGGEAQQIAEYVECGELFAALRLLEQTEAEVGRVLPLHREARELTYPQHGQFSTWTAGGWV
jgi:hypothetical protein